MAIRLRHRGWYGLVAIVVALIWLNGTFDRSRTHAFKVSGKEHPIAQLTARAEKQWTELQRKQSKTLGEAYKEYRRRYGRKPPKGFDAWYKWSIEKGVKLIDEYDSIHDDLRPFWGLSPAQIESRRVELIKRARSDRLFSLRIRNGEISDDPEGLASTSRWPINKHYYALLDGISQFLPDMDLTINLYDIPLVYTPYEERQRLTALGEAGKFATDEEHERHAEPLSTLKSDMSWRDLRRSCPPGSAIFDLVPDLFGEEILPPQWPQQATSFRLPDSLGGFIHDHQAAMDICQNPELIWQHGNHLTTRTLNLGIRRNYLYPVFSWTRYPQSSDILIPTSYRFRHDKPAAQPWKEMQSRIFWLGTMTGMDALDTADTFASQRYRLGVMVNNNISHVPVFETAEDGSSYRLSDARAGPLNEEWMQIMMSGKPEELGKTHAADVARARLRLLPWRGSADRDSYKILLDVDGWGWSARYRELLWTGAAVLKSTVFKEATTDWQVPWYHYIPLDYAYRDMYSLALYYLGLKGTSQHAHDAELQAIAEHSTQWVDDHATWDHHLSYMYRLCLEWARITSEDRDAMGYTYLGEGVAS